MHRPQLNGKIVCLLLLVLTLIPFWQVSRFEFNRYDDFNYVVENPRVNGGLSLGSFKWALTTTYFSYWHPLTWLSHIMDCELFGLKAGMHHLTSVLIHAANALVCFIFTRRLGGSVGQAGFVAGLFAVHPLHVESVAWIAERKDVLSGFFWLLTCWAYLRYATQLNRKWYFAAIGFYGLGIMSKPMVVTLPCVLFLLDFWPLNRIRFGPDWRAFVAGLRPLFVEKIPFFFLMLFSCAITYVGVKRAGLIYSWEAVPASFRLANVPVSYIRYLWKLVFPQDLVVLYPIPAEGWAIWQWTGASILVLGITVFCLVLWRRAPYLIVGWFWYLGTLVPTIGLLAVGDQSIADRYTYIPLIGIFIMLGWGIPAVIGKLRPALPIGATAILVACAFLTWRQTQTWRNTEGLFRWAATHSRNNHIAHYNLGLSLAYRNELSAAVKEFQEAARIKPTYAKAHHNLGIVQSMLGDWVAARDQFSLALQNNPHDATTHSSLGEALLQLGDITGATNHLRKAIAFNPNYARAHYALSKALSLTGATNDAIQSLTHALRVDPAYVDARVELSQLSAAQGLFPQAVAQLREAFRLQPNNPRVLDRLAWLLATAPDPGARSGPEAVRLAEQAVQITGSADPTVLGTLGAAYAESGMFSRAIAVTEQALNLAQSKGDAAQMQQHQQRLQTYQRNSPWRSN